MKRFLLCALFALSCSALAATDPSERYLEAYFLIQDGDDAETASDWVTANAKFTAAQQVLNDIKADAPDWHAGLLQFRSKYCSDHLAAIQPKLPVAVAPSPAPVEPQLTEADQVRQLQGELQKARDEVKKLSEMRDKLSTQLEAKLKEPAPSDRQTAKQTIEQLRALQAVNEAALAKLEQAKEKAARADQLEAQLQQSQERIRGLEVERTGLSAKLQEALGKLTAAQSSPQVEELMKKNSDLTAQLASAQAEITKMRDEMTAAGKETSATSEESVQLRAQVGQLRSELEQTKLLLTQRTEELASVRAENARLSRSQEEIMARLNENERQLRAARASTDKDNEIIQQLRKENALLREIAGKKEPAGETQAKATPPAKSKGFLWFKPKQPATPPPQTNQTEAAVSRSEAGKLTAAVKAPAHSEASREAAAEPPPESPATGSPIVRSLLAEARAAIAVRDLDTAAAKFQAVLQQEPNNVAALSNLGVIYYQQSKLDEAADILQKAVTAAPNDSQCRSVLGVVYFRKGRTEDAYNELTRAVALNPRNAEAHNYLGIIMSEKGWATAAEQEVRRALELNPDYADAHFNLAVIYSRQKTPRIELARYHYQRARELGSEADAQLETKLGLTAPAKP